MGGAGIGRSARRASQPIQALNPYNNNWTIKARVASKGQMRTFASKGGAGGTTSLFSVELVDEQARSMCLNSGPAYKCANPQDSSRAELCCCWTTACWHATW